jgi:hypothetical protein
LFDIKTQPSSLLVLVSPGACAGPADLNFGVFLEKSGPRI